MSSYGQKYMQDFLVANYGPQMPTVPERLAALEVEMEELRRLIEANRSQAYFWISQVIQIAMITALWFKK